MKLFRTTAAALALTTGLLTLPAQAEEVQAVLLMSAAEIFARQHDFTGSRIALLCESARAVMQRAGDSLVALRLLLGELAPP